MPISDESNKIQYQTNGLIREFSFKFKFFQPSDLIVSFWTEGEEGVILEEGTEYEVIYTDEEEGGFIVLKESSAEEQAQGVPKYPATPKAGVLLIARIMPLDQQAHIRPVSGFPEEVITNTFDKLVMIDQQQQEQLDRCIKVAGVSEIKPEALVEQVERIHENIEDITFVADNMSKVEYVYENGEAVLSASEETLANVNAAKESEIKAGEQADIAETQAANALTSAGEAKTSETNALIYANNSKASAESSLSHSNTSHIWAEGTDAEVQALGGDHSAKEWAKLVGDKPVNWGNLIGDIKDQTDLQEELDKLSKRSGFSLFDRKVSDHILEGEEALGWALQGTWVYKEAIAGERFGYPTFYETCVKEYFDGNTAELIPWEQPVLTSDGVLGGESFAVMADSVYSPNNLYKSFDGNDSTMWFAETAAPAPINLYFYNPKALIITNIEMTNRDKQRTYISGGVVYGSNDNANWVELKTFTNSVSDPTAKWNIDLSDNSRKFKYYRITITDIVYASSTSILGAGNITITAFTSESTNLYYSHPNGHNYYDISIKDQIDEQFNSTGMAWAYGVDTDNERIFLPRNKWFEQMTLDTNEVGDSVLAGLPNITGQISQQISSSGGITNGCFTSVKGQVMYGVSFGTENSRVKLDASLSNSIYGKSNTVQPNAVKNLLYICVGNAVADTSWINVVEQVQEGVKDIQEAEEEAIARLNATSNALNQTQITNCILEVPQRIKYTLQNGTLTIKAGSVVIVPYGVEDLSATYPVGSTFINDNFKVVDTQYFDGKFFVWVELVSDVSKNTVQEDTKKRPLCFDITRNLFSTFNDTTSSDTQFIGTGNNNNYRTDLNLIQNTINGTLTEYVLSFPLFIVNADGTNLFGSIKQIFNGFGYIGSTVWVDKGVKGLIPNGRNTDGTLNNTEITTDKISTLTLSSNKSYICVINSVGEIGASSNYSYLDEINRVYKSDTNSYSNVCFSGTCTITDGKITSFDAKKPVKLVTYDDIKDNIYITETYQNGTSWYRIYSDGWCEQGGFNDGSKNLATITLLQPFRDTQYTILTGRYVLGTADDDASLSYQARKITTTSFQIRQTYSTGTGNGLGAGGGYAYKWEAKGYIR